MSLAKTDVVVDLNTKLGDVKIMNAVNNGPSAWRSDQTRTNFGDYQALEIPYARTHDSAHCHAYGGCHSVDITGIFPDFSKDAEDPASYDFVETDDYLKTMRAAGTEPFYRLGQSIEHWIKKYGVNPPADFDKWAAICEHIVRHYNEGWADGFEWNITYWEIWNEPDLKPAADGRPSPTWTGTPEQFYDLFSKTVLRLKKAFPKLKIGGPALAYDEQWADAFLAEMRRRGVALDFFSWHIYAVLPEPVAEKAVRMRALLDKHGYNNTESILNEWNYVRNWSDDWIYSLQVEMGEMNYKGAAFVSAVLTRCQRAPIDMLMFYDARVSGGMNNLFDQMSLEPSRGYYPFKAWAKMRRLGTEAAVKIDGQNDIYVMAAVGLDGHAGILVTRYLDDDNVTAIELVKVRVEGRSLADATCHLTDKVRFYTQIFPTADEDGAITLQMKPNSFAFIEL